MDNGNKFLLCASLFVVVAVLNVLFFCHCCCCCLKRILFTLCLVKDQLARERERETERAHVSWRCPNKLQLPCSGQDSYTGSSCCCCCFFFFFFFCCCSSCCCCCCCSLLVAFFCNAKAAGSSILVQLNFARHLKRSSPSQALRSLRLSLSRTIVRALALE